MISLLLTEASVGFTAGGVFHLLVYLLILACIIGLIYYIATLCFPAAVNIIRIICLVAFLACLLLLLLPMLGI